MRRAVLWLDHRTGIRMVAHAWSLGLAEEEGEAAVTASGSGCVCCLAGCAYLGGRKPASVEPARIVMLLDKVCGKESVPCSQRPPDGLSDKRQEHLRLGVEQFT